MSNKDDPELPRFRLDSLRDLLPHELVPQVQPASSPFGPLELQLVYRKDGSIGADIVRRTRAGRLEFVQEVPRMEATEEGGEDDPGIVHVDWTDSPDDYTHCDNGLSHRNEPASAPDDFYKIRVCENETQVVSRSPVGKGEEADEVWVTGNGRRIPIRKMNTEHLRAVVVWLERKLPRIVKEQLISFYAHGPKPSGDMAQMAFEEEEEHDRLLDCTLSMDEAVQQYQPAGRLAALVREARARGIEVPWSTGDGDDA